MVFHGLRNRGPLKDLNDSKLIVYESKWFPWPSRINSIPFRIFRGSLFPKTVRNFFCCSLQQIGSSSILCRRYVSKYLRFRWCSTWYDTQDDDSIALRGNPSYAKTCVSGGLTCLLVDSVCLFFWTNSKTGDEESQCTYTRCSKEAVGK